MDEIDDLQRSLDSADTTIEKQEAEIACLKDRLKRCAEGYEGGLTILRKEIADLKDKLAQSYKDYAFVAKNRDCMQEYITKLEKQLAEAKQTITQLKGGSNLTPIPPEKG